MNSSHVPEAAAQATAKPATLAPTVATNATASTRTVGSAATRLAYRSHSARPATAPARPQ